MPCSRAHAHSYLAVTSRFSVKLAALGLDTHTHMCMCTRAHTHTPPNLQGLWFAFPVTFFTVKMGVVSINTEEWMWTVVDFLGKVSGIVCA